MPEPGEHQVLRIAGVRDEPGHVGAERLELELVDARRIDVDDDDAPAERIERAAEHPAGLAVARDQHERLAQAPHLACEALHGERVAKARSCSSESSVPIAYAQPITVR